MGNDERAEQAKRIAAAKDQARRQAERDRHAAAVKADLKRRPADRKGGW